MNQSLAVDTGAPIPPACDATTSQELLKPGEIELVAYAPPVRKLALNPKADVRLAFALPTLSVAHL